VSVTIFFNLSASDTVSSNPIYFELRKMPAQLMRSQRFGFAWDMIINCFTRGKTNRSDSLHAYSNNFTVALTLTSRINSGSFTDSSTLINTV